MLKVTFDAIYVKKQTQHDQSMAYSFFFYFSFLFNILLTYYFLLHICLLFENINIIVHFSNCFFLWCKFLFFYYASTIWNCRQFLFPKGTQVCKICISQHVSCPSTKIIHVASIYICPLIRIPIIILLIFRPKTFFLSNIKV